jgi:hypothetical protein
VDALGGLEAPPRQPREVDAQLPQAAVEVLAGELRRAARGFPDPDEERIRSELSGNLRHRTGLHERGQGGRQRFTAPAGRERDCDLESLDFA